jgi:tRNA-(ms[2]io[6]A)-hydroxylase
MEAYFWACQKRLTMLDLKLRTETRWAKLAQEDLPQLLADHAYCEQKAASACISLIVNYPDCDFLVDRLTPVVAEEWAHFRQVVEELRKRGFPLGKMRKDTYVNKLFALVQKGLSIQEQLLDKLLVSALIEARSCERFRVLFQNLEDEPLRKFYQRLMISEAGHYENFIEIAKHYFPHSKVDRRWSEMVAAEAQIIADLEPRGDRIH